MPKSRPTPGEAANRQQLAPNSSRSSAQALSKRPLLPPLYAPETLWQIALGELKHQMTRATFNAWLLDSHVIPEASSPVFLAVSVRNQYAREWLTYRLLPVIVRTLTGIAGYAVGVYFLSNVAELYEDNMVKPLEERLHQYASTESALSLSKCSAQASPNLTMSRKARPVSSTMPS